MLPKSILHEATCILFPNFFFEKLTWLVFNEFTRTWRTWAMGLPIELMGLDSEEFFDLIWFVPWPKSTTSCQLVCPANDPWLGVVFPSQIFFIRCSRIWNTNLGKEKLYSSHLPSKLRCRALLWILANDRDPLQSQSTLSYFILVKTI